MTDEKAPNDQPTKAAEASRELTAAASELDSLAPFDLGVVWPPGLSLGSFEDAFPHGRKTEANGFVVWIAKDGAHKIAAVATGVDDEEALRRAIAGILMAHRPRMVVTASLLAAYTAGRDESAPSPSRSWQKFDLVAADAGPVSPDLEAILRAEAIPRTTWRHVSSTKFDSEEAKLDPEEARQSLDGLIATDAASRIAGGECRARAVPLLSLGIVRRINSLSASPEVSDYRQSDSKAMKLGRMLRWAFKNRPALREATNAAQDDLIAGDKLAAAIKRLLRLMSDGAQEP